MHDDGQWTNYFTSTEHPELFFAGATNSFAFDNSGGTWAGSEGVGVAWFHDDSISFFNTWDSSGFDVNGPRLTLTAPPPPEPGYLVARVIRNAVGDIYIYNRLFGTDRRLMRVSGSWAAQGNHPEPWMYYGSIPEAQGKDLEPMLIDAYSRVWLGGQERNGSSTFVLDEMQTPDDTTGDQWFEYVPSSLQDQITCFDNILSGVVSWDIDKQGYLWVGTHNGAYYSQAGIPADLDFLRFICVVDLPTGNSVNAVHVDAQDNKWFGTDNGVAVMDKNFTWIHVFRTADSPEHRSDLASNTITSISSDPVSGDVWIGTTDGLSRLQTPYLSRGGELGELWPYPSPFVADGTHRLFVDHRRLGGRFDDLRVYTLSGRLVRELTWTQMISPGTGWDGRNDDGELVAGGVYLLLASSTDGNSATGKVAVLGK